MRLRPLAAALASAIFLVAGRASAWQEAHETGDDVVVSVDEAGVAEVRDTLKWHVVRGPLKTVDVVHVDPSAVVQPDVPIAAEDGRTLLAHAARRDEHTVRLTIDEPRALMRGDFTFDIRWRVDLAAIHAITRDGASWRLTWSAPVATDGFDAARTVLDLPAAPDAPVAIVADTGVVDDAAVSRLFRGAGRDRLELVRPHVTRGEAPVWTVRVDPQALTKLGEVRASAPSASPASPEPDRVREASLAVALGSLALFFGFVVRRKARAFAAACEARGATPRALVPVPDGARAAIAGVALAAGVGLEIAQRMTLGAACVGVAILAAALRAPKSAPKPRGPGRWLALRPEEAFAGQPAAWTADALAVLVGALLVAGLAFLAHRYDEAAPWLVVLDAAALVPLIATGRPSQLPPDARTSAPWLARAFRTLRAATALRVSPWARIPLDADAPDELRLLLLPRAAMPGVLGVELGLAWIAAPAGWSASPEVLARVVDGSAAAARIAKEIPGARTVPGRRPDERVVRLLPRAPTRAAAVALSRSLADALTDRREAAAGARPYTAPERRVFRPTVAPLRAEAAA